MEQCSGYDQVLLIHVDAASAWDFLRNICLEKLVSSLKLERQQTIISGRHSSHIFLQY
jgi:hypothetical protein